MKRRVQHVNLQQPNRWTTGMYASQMLLHDTVSAEKRTKIDSGSEDLSKHYEFDHHSEPLGDTKQKHIWRKRNSAKKLNIA